MRINVVIPICGSNKPIMDNSYTFNLYEIQRKTLLQHIYESLANIAEASFIVILKREDVEKFHLESIVRLMIPNVKIVVADGETMGAACTCLLAVDEIDNNNPLLVAAGNQLICGKLQKAINVFEEKAWDGGIIVFDDIHPKWSYVRVDENNFVIEAAEKNPISRNATAGFYYFRRGCDFVSAAENMIRKQASVEGQYYVCPVYNEMILQGKKIGTFKIEKDDYYNFNDERDREAYKLFLKGASM